MGEAGVGKAGLTTYMLSHRTDKEGNTKRVVEDNGKTFVKTGCGMRRI